MVKTLCEGVFADEVSNITAVLMGIKGARLAENLESELVCYVDYLLIP